jgi:2-methylisocitrate lyase-like PEP mutase family enzyme
VVPARLDVRGTQAQRLRDLHEARPLLVVNAWDAGSAAVMEAAGAPVIGTTSAGVSWACGVADGGSLGGVRAVEAVRRIAEVVGVPVTADIEDGYGDTPEEVGRTVTSVMEAGAVGINLEDRVNRGNGSLLTAAEQAARLVAARVAAQKAGIGLWINARTDVYLAGSGSPADQLVEAQSRAVAYAAAGADSLFVPGVVDVDTLCALVAGPLPVNAMVYPGAPTVSELAALGVARISLGSAVAQAAYHAAAAATRELIGQGTYTSLEAAMDYTELNDLLT